MRDDLEEDVFEDEEFQEDELNPTGFKNCSRSSEFDPDYWDSYFGFPSEEQWDEFSIMEDREESSGYPNFLYGIEDDVEEEDWDEEEESDEEDDLDEEEERWAEWEYGDSFIEMDSVDFWQDTPPSYEESSWKHLLEQVADWESGKKGLAYYARECVKLKRMIERLTEELREAKQNLLDQGMEDDKDLTVSGHNLKVCFSRQYEFSSELREIEAKLRHQKIREIKTGQAKLLNKTPYIRVARLLSDLRKEFPRSRMPWSDDEIEVLKGEMARKTSVREICRKLGRNPKSIRFQIARISSSEADSND